MLISILFCRILFSANAGAQTHSTSQTFSHMPGVHFTERNSSVMHQTWSIVQDSRGVLYVGDKDGVKLYNGQFWTIVPTTTGNTVRSLAVSDSDEIFYGSQGDFGRLVPDQQFGMIAVSISERYSIEKKPFGTVEGTHVLGREVIFQTPETIFIWDRDILTSIDTGTYFHTSFLVDGVFYVREAGVGLKKLIGRSLELIKGGELFAETRIYMMEVLTEGNILVGTQEAGLFIILSSAIVSIDSELDDFQNNGGDATEALRLYTGTRISSDLFAIGTLGAGLVVIDRDGKVIKVLDKNTGMPDDAINYVYLGQSGEIWMALDNAGVIAIDILASVVKYGDGLGIKGHARDIFRNKNELIVSTGAGLFVLTEPNVVLPADGKHFFFQTSRRNQTAMAGY